MSRPRQRRPGACWRFATRPALVAAVMVLSGCHTYSAVDRPSPGSSVRLATSGAERPAASTFDVEGRVVESGDTLVLAEARRRRLGQFRGLVGSDTLRLAATSYTALQTRRFAKGRSAVLAAAVLGGVAFVAANILAGVDKNSLEIPTPPDPGEAVVVADSGLAVLWRLLTGG